MSARITMPAPPPAGVSSTERCLSVAKSRMSMVDKAHFPSAKALPARLSPNGPGNISGKMVRMVARQVMREPPPICARPTLLLEQPGLDFTDALHSDGSARYEHEVR